jgi:hypothetical protein
VNSVVIWTSTATNVEYLPWRQKELAISWVTMTAGKKKTKSKMLIFDVVVVTTTAAVKMTRLPRSAISVHLEMTRTTTRILLPLP